MADDDSEEDAQTADTEESEPILGGQMVTNGKEPDTEDSEEFDTLSEG